MDVVALISGGKDSIYNIIQCQLHGHRIIALANLYPQLDDSIEIDSYMFQTCGHNILNSISECLQIPIYRKTINGNCINLSLDYKQTNGDEVEDLFELLSQIKLQYPSLQAVSCGAIFSSYQKNRVNDICQRLELVSLCYLWQKNQIELLQEMISYNISAILIKTACQGLFPRKHLGSTIQQLYPYLLELDNKGLCNPCGEGGEYETLVLDCPLYYKRIIIDEYKLCGSLDNPYAPYGHLVILNYHLEEKL